MALNGKYISLKSIMEQVYADNGYQYDADINSGFTYRYDTAVIEFDLNNGLGTGTSSAEYDSNQ